jgi:hypothetical protein
MPMNAAIACGVRFSPCLTNSKPNSRSVTGAYMALTRVAPALHTLTRAIYFSIFLEDISCPTRLTLKTSVVIRKARHPTVPVRQLPGHGIRTSRKRETTSLEALSLGLGCVPLQSVRDKPCKSLCCYGESLASGMRYRCPSINLVQIRSVFQERLPGAAFSRWKRLGLFL